jgi:hypothetical protein
MPSNVTSTTSKNVNTKSKTASVDASVTHSTKTTKRDRYSEPMFHIDSNFKNRYNALWAIEVQEEDGRWTPSPSEVFATRDLAAESEAFRKYRTGGVRTRIAKYLPVAVAKS